MSEPYEPGRYLATVIRQGFGVSRKGTEFFFLTVHPTHRVYDDFSEECRNNGDRDVNLYLTDDTIEFQIAALRHLGWGGVDFEELYSGTHSFVGLDVELSCEQREYKGKYYDQFSLYIPGGKKEVSTSAVASLTAKWADKLKATATDAPKRGITLEEAAAVAAEAGPDEIPF